MSQYPQYPGRYQPLPYSTPLFQPPSPRPTAVTVLAVIGIVIGSLGTLCGFSGILTNTIVLATGSNPLAAGVPREDEEAEGAEIVEHKRKEFRRN